MKLSELSSLQSSEIHSAVNATAEIVLRNHPERLAAFTARSASRPLAQVIRSLAIRLDVGAMSDDADLAEEDHAKEFAQAVHDYYRQHLKGSPDPEGAEHLLIDAQVHLGIKDLRMRS